MVHDSRPTDSRSVNGIVEQLHEVVVRLTGSGEPITTDVVVELAAFAIPHSHHCGLTLLRPGHQPATIAASDDLPREVDDLQYSLSEGPCLDAATGPALLHSDDISRDERWPRFGPRCAQATGVRSMLSLRLPVSGDDFAGINYYSTEVAAFTQVDVPVASVIVPLAALAVEAHLRHYDYENLITALESSRHISTAVGIVMATRRVSGAEAFALMRKASMDLNRKLHDVADVVNHTGELPTRRPRG